MTLDLTFHMLAMNDNCIQNSWLLIAKDFLIIFSLFLIFSHFLSLFIIFYHFKTFFTTLVVIIYIFKILAKLILANLGTKIDVPNEELPGEGEHYESHPLWQEVACSQQFKQFGKLQRHTKNQHINVSEVQAALEAEEEHGRRHPRSYYVHLVDSQVAAACLVKGRSSSWQLNRLLRQSLVTHLSHGCKPFYGYIRSQFNPGDDPTRGVVVREPVVEEAAWLTHLKEGEPGGMDDFLVSIGLGLRQMAGLPDPNELLADAPYDYRRAKEQEHTPPNFIHQSRSPTIHIPKKKKHIFSKKYFQNFKNKF